MMAKFDVQGRLKRCRLFQNETARNLTEKGFGLFASVRQTKWVGRKACHFGG